MASFAKPQLLALVLCFLISIGTAHGSSFAAGHDCKAFHPIFAFGDSTTDTGNQVRSSANGTFSPAANPPYGSTFFKKATGRYSDGRLMVDFLTSALKEGFLPAHLEAPGKLRNASQNFAVAGATALDLKTLQRLANVTSFTPESLESELAAFSIETAGADFSNALVYFGEIGGNDFNYALAAHRPHKVLNSLFKPITHKISSSLDSLLKRGVKHIVVQGQFPMGCISLYLKTLNGTKTDKHGCIQSVMQISDRHNHKLKRIVHHLAKKHKHANIVFFDTSAAYVHILDHASKYNFTNVQDPCYVGALQQMIMPSTSTSSSSIHAPVINMKACPNPQNYVGWDGIHLTDAMYGKMMKLFLTDPSFSSPFPNFLTKCTKI
ncbi:hypothetical protein GOP47_0005686 [Adiantum capillus-veneris]|uniref:GDSL esterase/lipase n=1 Tax=Adiantum capillus-veneris TaxID=13818 RepID=A0A9D4V688_ADICA|nr:hypothetical protein GOP47_0005686 [Adiantum capillus-veneris]